MKQYIAARFQRGEKGLTLDTEALRRYPDVIDLSIGDTDFPTDSAIVDPAFADARAGYTHYGDPKGDPELIDAIRAAWQEDYGQEISREEVLVTASSCMGMSQVLFALLNPGDEVIVIAPYFAVYRQQIELAGGVCVEAPTRAENGFEPEEQTLQSCISERTRAIIVNNPCNPTGAVYGRETLEMLSRLAREHDLLILADEIYTRYVYEGEFIPLRTLAGMKERTVTLNSFSKNFMMTGWRVGYIIAHPELVQVALRVNGGLTYTTPSISQRAALYALPLRNQIAEKQIRIYQDRVQHTADRLEKLPWITLCRPRGTFYLFPGIGKTGLSDTDFCDRLLEESHVLVSPGSAFGQAGRGHFRIAATVPEEKLAEAVDRMANMNICIRE